MVWKAGLLGSGSGLTPFNLGKSMSALWVPAPQSLKQFYLPCHLLKEWDSSEIMHGRSVWEPSAGALTDKMTMVTLCERTWIGFECFPETRGGMIPLET